MKHIYILLTRSKTIVSRTVGVFTTDTYTHASIAFDGKLDSLCSFTRKYPKLVVPAGLYFEDINSNRFSRYGNIPCMLLCLEVDDKTYLRAKRKVRYMFLMSKKLRFNVRGLLLCKFGIMDKRRRYFFCSQFVGEVLKHSGAVSLPKPPALMHPQDYADITEFKKCYEGNLSGLICFLNEQQEVLV